MWSINSTSSILNSTHRCNGTDVEGCVLLLDAHNRDSTASASYWALVLLIIPCLTLFGNLLVIISVVTKRNLHSPINYFILGLAVADMCVAIAVMPFAVYVEFNEHWELGTVLCDLYCAADVTCSTASIFLLTVISFDRYVAATQPIRYANSAKGIGRVAVINLAVWLVSMLIASPMVLGLNNVPDRDPTKCMFYNADFIIYSSTGSFCIPLVIIMYLYARIYCVIRQRGRFAKQRQELISAASRCSVVTGMESLDKTAATTGAPQLLSKVPLPSVIEYSMVQNDDDDLRRRKDVINPNGGSKTDDNRNRTDCPPDETGAQNLEEEATGIVNLLSPVRGRRKMGRATVLDVREEAINHDRAVVLRCQSVNSALPPRRSSMKPISEVSAELSNESTKAASNGSRRFSMPNLNNNRKRQSRHWSLARSSRVTREAGRDVSTTAALLLDAKVTADKPPSDSLPSQESVEDEQQQHSPKYHQHHKVSLGLSVSTIRTRHSSVAIDTGSTVTIICPSMNGDCPPSPLPQRRSAKSSFSMVVSGWRRMDARKRMSEGSSSPLLRSDTRAGFQIAKSRINGKRSLEEAAQAARSRWLRRLSTRLVLWRFHRDTSSGSVGGCADPTTMDGTKQPLLYQNERRFRMPRKSTSKQRKEKKATKTLAIVLGIFLMCWLPFFGLNLLNAVCMKLNTDSCQVGFLPFFLTTWLGYTNSFLNPIIYTIFNQDFRRAFKDILCGWFKRAGRRSI